MRVNDILIKQNKQNFCMAVKSCRKVTDYMLQTFDLGSPELGGIVKKMTGVCVDQAGNNHFDIYLGVRNPEPKKGVFFAQLINNTTGREIRTISTNDVKYAGLPEDKAIEQVLQDADDSYKVL